MSRRRKHRRFGSALGAGLLSAAVATELRKPRRRRTGYGRIGGLIPYDLRPPTLERYKLRWWNPDDPRLLTPRAFGVGWDINFGRLLSRR
jgi:hypothetical protein